MKKEDPGSKRPKLTARSLSLICLKIHFPVGEPTRRVQRTSPPKPMTSNELPTTQTATHKTTNFMNMNNKMLNPPMVCVHQVTQTVLVQQMKRWVLCKRWTPWKLTTMMKLKTKKRDMAKQIKLTIMEIVM